MSNKTVHVSDHALLRYFERVLGLDVEEVRRLIADQVRGAVAAGACKTTIDGVQFTIRGSAVTTCADGRLYSANGQPRSIKTKRRISVAGMGGVE